MDKEYTIISVDKPDDSIWDVVGWGIHNYNEQQAGEIQHKQLCFTFTQLTRKLPAVSLVQPIGIGST